MRQIVSQSTLRVGLVATLSVMLAAAVPALSSAARAASPNPADLSESYNRCMTAAGGSDPGMEDCTNSELARQDARLNRAYKLVMAKLSSAEQTALRNEERSWLQNTKSFCDRAGDENEGGTAQPLQVSDCYLTQTTKRADYLAGYQTPMVKHLDSRLRAFLVERSPADAKTERDWPTRVTIAEVRRDDGGRDILVYMSGRGSCGSGGCDLLMLEPNGASYRMLGDVSIVQLPIRRLGSTSNGHPDIGVQVRGGGILPGYEARLRFDGKSYPGNPSVPPAEPVKGTPKGTVLIAQPVAGAPDIARGDLLHGG